MSVELASGYIDLSVKYGSAMNKIAADFTGLKQKAGRAGTDAGDVLGKNMLASTSKAADKIGPALQSQVRGEKIGRAIGTVIGKGIGATISVGIAGAATVATAAVGTLTLSLSKGFTRLKTIDQAKFKLKALGNSAADVEKIMDSALKAVKGTSFGLGDAATVAAGAVAAGIKPGQQLTEYLTLVADTAAVAGTSFEEMAFIFNKMRTGGKVFTDDLNQIAGRGLPVFQLLATQFNVTQDELRKMVEDGKVQAADLERALQGNIGGAAQKMGDSFSGAVEKADAALARLGEALLKPAFGQAAGQIGGVTSALDEMTTWVDNNQDVVIGFFGESAKAAVIFGQGVLTTAEWTARSLGWIMNAFGDSYGALTKVVSGVNRLLGRDEIADELLATAEASFGMGDGLLKLADEAGDAVHPLYEVHNQIDRWKVGAQNAARETQFLKDGLGDLVKKAEISSGTTIIKAPTAAELNAIDKAVFAVEQIPATQDFLVIPQTDQAAEALIAFRNKESEKPVEIPAESDTKPAADGVGEWRTNEQGNPVRVPVAPDLGPAETAMEGFLAKWSTAIISPTVSPGMPGASGPGGYNPLSGPISSNPGNVDTGGALTAENQAVQDYLRNTLGFTGDIGGYRPPDGYNEHSSGKASDVMVSSAAEGNALLPNLLMRPGVEYIMWQNKLFYPDGRVVPDSTPSDDPTQGHFDHLHVKTFDEGGWWRDGVLGLNSTGEDELVLNPDHLKNLRDQGVDPNTLLHGQGQGTHPGPSSSSSPAGAAKAGLDAMAAVGGWGRTEGYIPAGAGNSSVAGTSFLSGLYGMGADVINGLIDQAASAASTAVAAGIAGGTMGAGAVGGSQAGAAAAQTLIGLGTNAAKRGVDYGAQMLGIFTDATIEQLTPFGAPRWISTDPTAFMPQQLLGAATTSIEKAFQESQGLGGESAGGPVQPGQMPGVQTVGDPAPKANAGGAAAPSIAAGMFSGPPAPQQSGPQQGGQAETDAQTGHQDMLKQLGVYDQGGWLQPGGIAINRSNRPEPMAVFNNEQWGNLSAIANTPPAELDPTTGANYDYRTVIESVTVKDVAELERQMEDRRRLNMMRYSGRPTPG